MRIVIDLQACQLQRPYDELGRFSLSLTRAMARQAGGHELWIALNERFPETVSGLRADFEGLLARERIVTFSVPGQVAEHKSQNSWRTRGAELLREYFLTGLNPDIVHVSSLFAGWQKDAVASIGAHQQNILTSASLYDMPALIAAKNDATGSALKKFYSRKLLSLQKADCVFLSSDYTRRQAIDDLGLPAGVLIKIPRAADEFCQTGDVPAAEIHVLQKRLGLRGAFILFAPGQLEQVDRIRALITAFTRLDPDLQDALQLVVPVQLDDDEVFRISLHARNMGLLASKLILPGALTGPDVFSLYKLCTLAIFGGQDDELVGLKAIDALACGAAVLGALATSLPELLGNQDALYDPQMSDALALKMHRALTDEAFRKYLRESGRAQAGKFSWDCSAAQVLDAFGVLHDKMQGKTRRVVSLSQTKPRLAYFSPLPPEKSGISDYSAELLPHLARFYDITLIKKQGINQEVSLGKNFPSRDLAWFESNNANFDRILYQMGNSPYHSHMPALLDRYPGVVVMHDFFLGDLLNWLELNGPQPGLRNQSLYISHGYQALSFLKQNGAEKTQASYPSNKAMLDLADGVVVHSQLAIQQAQVLYGAGMAAKFRRIPQLRSLPKAFERAQARNALGLPKDAFVVCSFGMLGGTKLNQRLLDAWLASPILQDKSCQLVFVGEIQSGQYEKDFLEKLSRSKFKDNIQITGFVSKKSYEQYLEAADVAVQLRTAARGETSRSVLDALAYGVALILNAHGTMAEYPNDILIKLADNFTDRDLTEALEYFYKNPAERKRLASQGQPYIAKFHSQETVALAYREVIEQFAVQGQNGRYKTLLQAVAS